MTDIGDTYLKLSHAVRRSNCKKKIAQLLKHVQCTLATTRRRTVYIIVLVGH